MFRKDLIWLLLNLLMIIVLIFAANFISSHNIGAIYHFERISQSFLAIIAVRISQRLVKMVIWPLYEKKRGKIVPHLLKDLADFFLLAAGILFIIVGIFEESIFSITAAGGLIAAGLAIAVQGLIQDVFGALVIDIDVPFQIGDWLQLPNGTQGKVHEIAWRHTALLISDHTVVYVPNGQLMRDQVINMSQPASNLLNTVEITLDSSVPVHRARRILDAALSNLESIHQHTYHVYAHAATESGITYAIRYMIPEHSVWREVRHEIIQAVTETLLQYNLKLSDNGVEYTLAPRKDPLAPPPSLSNETVIRNSKLFSGYSETFISKAASLSKSLTFQAGKVIIQQGEVSSSVYLIVEGAVVIEHMYDGKVVESFLTFPDSFAEHAFYLNMPSNVTVKAKTEVLILELTREAIKQLFADHPEGLEKIATVIAEHHKELMMPYNASTHALEKNKDSEKNKNSIIEEVIFKLHHLLTKL